MTENRLTSHEVAAWAGVKPGTIYAYKNRGYIPQPDGYVGVTPWWHKETIVDWLAERNGRAGASR